MKHTRIEIDLERLEDCLPHGSGINSAWEFIQHKNGKVTCINSFHALNESGYYVGYMPFKFTVQACCDSLVMNRVVCNEKRLVDFHGLREYLEDTIANALESY